MRSPPANGTGFVSFILFPNDSPMLTADTILIAKLNRVFFYTDATGVTVVGPTRIMSGGTNIGQDNPPSRGIGEVVGTYTGKSQQNSKGEVLLEVNWTNSFYKSKANLFTPGAALPKRVPRG